VASNFEYTKNKYYRDEDLWGAFVDSPTLAGSFHSPSEKIGLDARAYYGNTEAAAHYYQLRSGNGTVYAADRVQTNAPITYTDSSFHLRHTEELTSVSSTTMVRYRTSNVDNPTTYLARFDDGSLFYAEDKSSNFSVTLQQDFRVSAARGLIMSDDELLFDLGAKYEYKDLERGFVENSVSFPSAADVDLSALPMSPVPGINAGNRKPANNLGGYLLGKYKFLTHHWLNLGLRADYRELVHDTSVAFRGGYIGSFMDALTIKLLYGQATQEPTARELFAVVAGSTANPNLREERSQTLELNASYVMQWFGATADVYWANYKNPIIGAGKTFINVGKRDVAGLDVGLQALPPIDFVRQLKLWMYYSTYLYAKESSFIPADDDSPARSGSKKRIGDISRNKIMGGATVDFTSRVGFTLLARWFSERKTVASNPIDAVAGYLTVDANLLLSDLPFESMMIDVRCTNLLDARYYHPGIKAADSGDTPGSFAGGVWTGSQGDFNSLLPQPGRAFTLTVGMSI
jgi:iron complex outermembrane receptor protein